MKNKIGNQWLFSIILFIVGVGLLLANLGVISWGIKNLFYIVLPIGIFLFGLFQLFNSFIKHQRSNLLTGLFFVIYGGLLIGANNHLVEFHYGDWWRLWPVVLIYTAIKVLFAKKIIVVSHHDDFSSYEKWNENSVNEASKKIQLDKEEVFHKKNKKQK